MENQKIAEEKLKELKKWEISPDQREISRLFEFKKLEETLDFIINVANFSKKINRFPEMKIFDNFRKIKVTLSAKEGLKEKDFVLAKEIEEIAEVKVKVQQFLTSPIVILILLIIFLFVFYWQYFRK